MGDGAHHLIAETFQALNDEVPESTSSTTAAVVRNAAHLAGVLKAAQFPRCPF